MLAAVMPEITRPTNSQLRRRRERHQDVVEAEPEIRHQDHRPAAEAVGQRALHRREHELHQRPGGAEHAEDLAPPPACRRRGRSTTSFGSTGMIMPSASMSSSTVMKMKTKAAVRRAGARDCGFVHRINRISRPGLSASSTRRVCRLTARRPHLRLAYGFFFSRSVRRIGVPGRSNVSRKALTR